MNWLKVFDGISMKTKLYSGANNDRLQTNFGGFMSILCYSTILSAIVYFYYRFLQYDSPFIVQNDIIEDYPIWKNFNEIPFMVRMSDDKSVPYSQADKLYYVTGLWIQTQETNGSLVQVYETINFKKCNMSDTMSYSFLFNQTGLIDSYYCPIFNKNVDMYGYYGGITDYSFFIVFIRQCNSQNPASNCLLQPDINNLVEGSTSYVDLLTVDNYPAQYSTDPKTAAIYSLRENISNTIQTRLWLGLHHVDYYTDFGLIFEELQSTSFHMIEYYKQTLMLPSVDKLRTGVAAMGLISIYNHKFKTIYNRSYKKFQELLAQLGGIIKAISIIAELIFFPYGSNSVYLKLVNSIIHITRSQESLEADTRDDQFNLTTCKLNNFVPTQAKPEDVSRNLLITKNRQLRKGVKLGFIDSIVPIEINCTTRKDVKLFKASLNYLFKNLTIDNLLQTNYELNKLKLMLLSQDEQIAFKYLWSSEMFEESKLMDLEIALKSVLNHKSLLKGFLQSEIKSTQ